jgi:Na+-transporting NADH:ubiquinone oxidoreductase subunit C
VNGKESAPRVLLVAFGVALFCALFVSTAVYWLRPIQATHLSIGQNRAVLVAAGLVAPDEELSDSELLSRFAAVHTQLVDLETGRVVESDPVLAGLYDYRVAIADPEQIVAISEDQDTAGLGSRPRIMPMYRLRGGQTETRIVLPVYGRGMWSTIHGFIGLDGDFSTVTGVTFHELGETAGIGDRIQRPGWLASWAGKRVYRDDGTVGIRIGTDLNGANPIERVDSITGATVTVTAVDGFVRYWLGPDAWGPVLGALRADGS